MKDHFEEFDSERSTPSLPVLKGAEFIMIFILLLTALLKNTSPDFYNSVFLVVATLLAFLYLLMGFAIFNNIELSAIFKRKSYYKISVWQILQTILLGICYSGIVFGILFRFLYLPGDYEMLLLSTGLLTVLLISSLSADLIKRKGDSATRSFYIRGLGALITGIAAMIFWV